MAKELDVKQARLARIESQSAAVLDVFRGVGFTVVEDDDPLGAIEAQLNIASRITEANSMDELFGVTGGTTSGKEFTNRPFRVVSNPTIHKSGKKGGIGWYMRIPVQIIGSDGTVHDDLISCGAMNVMVKLAQAAKLNHLTDTAFMIVEVEGETANGYKPLDLARAGGADRVTTAAAAQSDEPPY